MTGLAEPEHQPFEAVSLKNEREVFVPCLGEIQQALPNRGREVLGPIRRHAAMASR
jgi:hypothetical protein